MCGTAKTTWAETRSVARLVTSAVTPEQAPRIATIADAASTPCFRLSRTRSFRRWHSAAWTPANGVRSPTLTTPRARDHGRDQRRIGHRGQGLEDDAVGEIRGQAVGDGQGEPGLADAAGSGQRQEADVGVAEQPPHRRRLDLPAEERR